MSTEENRRLLERIFDGLATGDARLLVDSMADDFRWNVTGKTSWSGTYAGKQAVLNELLGPLRGKIVDRVRTTARSFIAEGDRVVVEARGSNMTCSGSRYDNEYCFVFRFEGGKLSEVTEYMDTELVSAVLGERVGG